MRRTLHGRRNQAGARTRLPHRAIRPAAMQGETRRRSPNRTPPPRRTPHSRRCRESQDRPRDFARRPARRRPTIPGRRRSRLRAACVADGSARGSGCPAHQSRPRRPEAKPRWTLQALWQAASYRAASSGEGFGGTDAERATTDQQRRIDRGARNAAKCRAGNHVGRERWHLR